MENKEVKEKIWCVYDELVKRENKNADIYINLNPGDSVRREAMREQAVYSLYSFAATLADMF